MSRILTNTQEPNTDLLLTALSGNFPGYASAFVTSNLTAAPAAQTAFEVGTGTGTVTARGTGAEGTWCKCVDKNDAVNYTNGVFKNITLANDTFIIQKGGDYRVFWSLSGVRATGGAGTGDMEVKMSVLKNVSDNNVADPTQYDVMASFTLKDSNDPASGSCSKVFTNMVATDTIKLFVTIINQGGSNVRDMGVEAMNVFINELPQI
jgi:hypothetical protein